MNEFRRTTSIYLVQDRNSHLLNSLRKKYFTFGCEYGNESFCALILQGNNKYKISLLVRDNNKQYLKDHYEYISDDAINDNEIIKIIDEQCGQIGDLQSKNKGEFYAPVFRE